MSELGDFIKRTAKQWAETEKALRKLGYGPALDHDTALLKSMGQKRRPSDRGVAQK